MVQLGANYPICIFHDHLHLSGQLAISRLMAAIYQYNNMNLNLNRTWNSTLRVQITYNLRSSLLQTRLVFDNGPFGQIHWQKRFHTWGMDEIVHSACDRALTWKTMNERLS